MDSPFELSKVNFVIDGDGRKTAAIIPIELYQQLLSLRELVAQSNTKELSADYSFSVKQAVAYGYPVGAKNKPGFIVIKGSTANGGGAESLRPAVLALREQLLEEHVLCRQGEGYEFMRDHQFSSPSSAACLIAGNARSGLDAWLDKWGRSLKDRGYGKKR
ncbi:MULTISPECIES: DUF4357 domain-containing protein [unclassified Agarivorans]|uniref:DUF4357 domain-containing protein n=1 Tax=unclassified Agarivorans TaxID=2636026 RepID=UPI003D7D13F8